MTKKLQGNAIAYERACDVAATVMFQRDESFEARADINDPLVLLLSKVYVVPARKVAVDVNKEADQTQSMLNLLAEEGH